MSIDVNGDVFGDQFTSWITGAPPTSPNTTLTGSLSDWNVGCTTVELTFVEVPSLFQGVQTLELTFTGGNGLSASNGLENASGSAVPVPDIAVSQDLSAGPGWYDITATGTGPSADPPAPLLPTITDNNLGSCTPSSSTISSGTGWTTASGTCQIPNEVAGASYTVTATYPSDTNYETQAPNDQYSPVYSPVFTFDAVSGTSTTISDSDPLNDGESPGSVNVTADGGTPGTDWLSETQYGVTPTGDLGDGSDFFDVAANQANMFSSIVVQYCNNSVTPSTILEYQDPTTGAWSDVTSPANEMAYPSLGQDNSLVTGEGLNPPCVSVTLYGQSTSSDHSSPALDQLTGTVFTTAASRSITSADSTTATVGSPFSFDLTTWGRRLPLFN